MIHPKGVMLRTPGVLLFNPLPILLIENLSLCLALFGRHWLLGVHNCASCSGCASTLSIFICWGYEILYSGRKSSHWCFPVSVCESDTIEESSEFKSPSIPKIVRHRSGPWDSEDHWRDGLSLLSVERHRNGFLCLSWSGQVDSAQQPTPRGKYVHMQYVCRKYVANFLLTQEFQAICSQLVLVLCWWNILRRCCCVALTGPELTAVLLRPIPPLVTFQYIIEIWFT